jgi:CheY-like chemotaxis protein
MRHGDFAETLRWLANEVQAKHGLVVHVEADGEVRSESEAIKSLLFRAAQELLFNVVKYARVREACLRVRQCERCICLSVSDHGCGFDPQMLGETAGFGLLSIRERVELLKGRMKIRSAPGRGSTVFIAVPRSEQELARPPAGAEGTAPEATELHAEAPTRLRILLADDHEITREGLLALLQDEHSVEVVGEAANGREAVALAEELEPDVVVMDVSMPLMDGDEATRQIKAHRPQTRVIALSMYDEPAMMEQMHQAGAESYVIKTAPTEELLAAIRGEKPDSEPVASGR